MRRVFWQWRLRVWRQRLVFARGLLSAYEKHPHGSYPDSRAKELKDAVAKCEFRLAVVELRLSLCPAGLEAKAKARLLRD